MNAQVPGNEESEVRETDSRPSQLSSAQIEELRRHVSSQMSDALLKWIPLAAIIGGLFGWFANEGARNSAHAKTLDLFIGPINAATAEASRAAALASNSAKDASESVNKAKESHAASKQVSVAASKALTEAEESVAKANAAIEASQAVQSQAEGLKIWFSHSREKFACDVATNLAESPMFMEGIKKYIDNHAVFASDSIGYPFRKDLDQVRKDLKELKENRTA